MEMLNNSSRSEEKGSPAWQRLSLSLGVCCISDVAVDLFASESTIIDMHLHFIIWMLRFERSKGLRSEVRNPNQKKEMF